MNNCICKKRNILKINTMAIPKKTVIKEGIQNLKYELAFIKHKLDLVENLIVGLEENVYSDEPASDLEDRLLNVRFRMLMEEYQKLHNLVNPDKVRFDSEEQLQQIH